MENRKAFTLIELLVVIAIIAILAAILFPVFAQAKQAAKASASLSNAKQVGLGAIMYSADHDDMAVMHSVWNGGNDLIVFTSRSVSPWPFLLQPYLKNAAILQDPQAPPSAVVTTNTRINPMIAVQYGYNDSTFNPRVAPALSNAAVPISLTAVGDPSQTVFFAGRSSTSELGHPSWAFGGFGIQPEATLLAMSVQPPLSDYGRIYNWGNFSWHGIIFFDVRSLTNGAWTGFTTFRGPGQATVLWADGSAGRRTPGSLARGTNFTPATMAVNVDLTDRSLYLWDLE